MSCYLVNGRGGGLTLYNSPPGSHQPNVVSGWPRAAMLPERQACQDSPEHVRTPGCLGSGLLPRLVANQGVLTGRAVTIMTINCHSNNCD
jgi:hypothetical protein